MANIYQVAMESKFQDILRTISYQYGHGSDLSGLTSGTLNQLEALAEQAIFNWAVGRKARGKAIVPVTNLHHLLDDYCALAEVSD